MIRRYMLKGIGSTERVYKRTDRHVLLEYVFEYDPLDDLTIEYALRSRGLLLTDRNKQELISLREDPQGSTFNILSIRRMNRIEETPWSRTTQVHHST